MNQNDLWMLQEDALVAIITQAMAPGGVLAVQPNPDGTTGVQLLERIVPPEQNVFPAIGVAFRKYDETQAASNTHDVVALFDLMVAVRQPFNAQNPDTASAAKALLRNYVNDGSGNGLSPLLRVNGRLSGTAQWGLIRSFEIVILQSDASASDCIAAGLYTYETHTRPRTVAS